MIPQFEQEPPVFHYGGTHFRAIAEHGQDAFVETAADDFRALARLPHAKLLLLSTPSIVAGAFVYAVVVVALGSFSAFAGAVALTVLMWPIITRATEEILRLVPQDYREGALALGVPRWRTITKVVVPTAGAGIFTAIMLAVARGLGETAPVLLTALGNDFMNTNLMRPTDTLSLRVFNYAQQPSQQFVTIAWGGAIMLLLAVLALSITARILSNRQQRRLG